jgi:glycosyltransferase involved in cell wall biosynthesis
MVPTSPELPTASSPAASPARRVRGISVVVPVYNSQDSLPLLVERLEAVLPALADEFELVLVNDGSRDRSWEVLQALARENPRVRPLCMMRNYGQHNALLAGIRAARFPITVTLDDDLQHPPEEIPRLLARLQEGWDVVYGTPEREQHGLLRDLASQITKLALSSAMGAETARKVSAYRVFRTQVRRAFEDYRAPYVSIDVLLTWGTVRFTSLPVRHEARTLGQSNYTFRKLVTHAMNMMTGFSTAPLQVASLIGFSMTLFGLGSLLFVILRYLLVGVSVPGFYHLASLISILSGANLFAVGIMGEYLARIHFRTMNRPSYVVREENGMPEGEDEP